MSGGVEVKTKIGVTFFQRRPQGANYSIERMFQSVRQALPETVKPRVAVSRFPSRGFFRRLYNILEAPIRQGEINHITGDVHYLVLLLKKRKTLLTICDLVVVNRLQGIRRILFNFFWYRLPIQRSCMVTVISNFTKKELLEYFNFDPQKIRVIHVPVSEEFKPSPKVFDSKKPVILQVGTGPNKNLKRVALALRGISCHFRIIGKLTNSQCDEMKGLGIDFSWVSDLEDWEIVDEYRSCDILVFASLYEGFGLPIVEAQATGRAVVTSHSEPMTEVAGKAACFVDPYDVESIRKGVRKVIQEQVYREKLIQQGYENVLRFRPKTIAEQYVKIYNEILSHRFKRTRKQFLNCRTN